MRLLGSNFPTDAALPKQAAPRAKRKRGKVGRSYVQLGTRTTVTDGKITKGFFPLPVTWGDTPVARAIRAQGGERVAHAGSAPTIEYPVPRAPDRGTVVDARVEPAELCPAPVTVGAGASIDEAAIGRSPTDLPTRFVTDGDNAQRDARRRAIVRAMIKASRNSREGPQSGCRRSG